MTSMQAEYQSVSSIAFRLFTKQQHKSCPVQSEQVDVDLSCNVETTGTFEVIK